MRSKMCALLMSLQARITLRPIDSHLPSAVVALSALY